MAWWKEKKTWRILMLLSFMAAFAYLFYLVRGLFFSFALAVLISYLLNPLVNALARRGTPRVWAILLSYLALFIVASSFLMYGIPRIVSQLNGLTETLPVYTSQTYELIYSIQSRFISLGLPEGMRQIIDERIQWIEALILQAISHALAAIFGLLESVFKILLAPVISFYILKDLELIKSNAISVIPEEWREETIWLFKETDKVLGSFIRGYLLVAAIIGGLTAAVMAVLGVEFSLMLGVFAGLAELIPYFGPIIGAVPAVGLVVLHSKWLAVKVALAFLVIHQLEGSIISPKILGDRVGLHPLLIIFSLLAGGKLYGLAGMLLAVPSAAILRVFVKFILLKVAAWQ